MNPLLKNFFILLLFTTLSLPTFAQTVRMETVLGDIDIELHPDVAPVTVANFLNYVNDGDYNNSYFHRSVRNFIIQGGGFTFINGTGGAVVQNSPIVNEYNLPNVRGTISMAKPSTGPDTATSQWFFNTVNNTDVLGPNNPANPNSGGFTVFGTVTPDSMAVVDAIAALDISNAFAPPIDNIPLINYTSGDIEQENFALITNVSVLETPFTMNLGLNGNWFNQETSGQGIFLDILGGLDLGFMGWFTYDTQLPADDTEANVGSAGHRWLTGLGDVDYDNNSITFDLTSTSGGLFDNGQSVTNTEAESYGTLTMAFTDCNNATVDYNLIAQELSGTFSVTRVAGNVDLCERLSREAAR